VTARTALVAGALFAFLAVEREQGAGNEGGARGHEGPLVYN